MINNSLKIATPISDLFIKKVNAYKILSNSDCLECRDHTLNSNYKSQELFHCELQPIHDFNQKDINYLEKIKSLKTDLKLISFHLASCYKYPELKKNQFFPKGNKISREKLIINSKRNFLLINKIFGNKISVAVENNNHYDTEAYDYITDPNFISQIVNENKINFLYDIAHAKISSYNFKIKLEDYENSLPMNKMIQIHIAKPGFNTFKQIYDKHDLPSNKELSEVIHLLNKYKKIKYLTVEYYKSSKKLINFLKRLKSIKTNY